MKYKRKKSISAMTGARGAGLIFAVAVVFMLGLLAAGGRGELGTSASDRQEEATEMQAVDSADPKQDQKKVKIVFQGTHIASSHSSGVHIEGNRVRITEAGTYVLRGSLEDGQIIVDAGKEDEIVLKLNNVSVHCEDSAPLWIRKAGKIKIRLKDDSENSFSDGIYYQGEDSEEAQPKACIDARCDLNIKGEKGSLTLDAAFRDGIYSSDDLKVKSGSLMVSAQRDALRGKDSVQIEDGDLSLEGGRDGIHSKGSLQIKGGHIRIKAARYGLYAFEEIMAREPARLEMEPPLSQFGCKGPIQIEEGVGQ